MYLISICSLTLQSPIYLSRCGLRINCFALSTVVQHADEKNYVCKTMHQMSTKVSFAFSSSFNTANLILSDCRWCLSSRDFWKVICEIQWPSFLPLQQMLLHSLCWLNETSDVYVVYCCRLALPFPWCIKQQATSRDISWLYLIWPIIVNICDSALCNLISSFRHKLICQSMLRRIPQ